MASEFHRHLCDEECVYNHEGTDVARIGRDILKAEAEDFIGYPAGGEAHDLRNNCSSHMIYIIVG